MGSIGITAYQPTSLRVSADDTSPSFLESKLSAGTGISLATQNPGANENVQISATVTSSQLYMSAVERAKSPMTAASVSYTVANLTIGCQFYPLRAFTVTGVRFYAKSNAYPKTYKCSLWNITDGGAALATVDVVAAAEGEYTGTFGAAYVIPANKVNKIFAVSIWEKSGTNYPYVDNDVILNAFSNLLNGPGIFMYTWKCYGAGDVIPGTVGGGITGPAPVDPVIA